MTHKKTWAEIDQIYTLRYQNEALACRSWRDDKHSQILSPKRLALALIGAACLFTGFLIH